MTAARGRLGAPVDRLPRRRVRVLSGLLTALLVGLVAGCGSSSTRSASDEPAAAPTSAPPPVTPSPSTSAATAAPTAAPPALAPAGPAAGPSRPAPAPSPGGVLAVRPGAVPQAQRLRAPAVPFSAPARYPDGLALAVRDVTHAVATDTGPGAQPGQAVTTLTVEVTNGSPTPVDLSGVVMSVTAGAARSAADPVYGSGQEDFSGILGPGARTSAVYAFAIPESERGDVTLTMDVDGRHAPALWRGAVT